MIAQNSDYEFDISGAYEHETSTRTSLLGSESDESDEKDYDVVESSPFSNISARINYTVITTTLSKYKIGNTLKPFTYYEFRLSAANSLGESRTSRPLIVRTASTSKKNNFN
jgi:hypothetical protein